jgi:hypothetical protein
VDNLTIVAPATFSAFGGALGALLGHLANPASTTHSAPSVDEQEIAHDLSATTADGDH